MTTEILLSLLFLAGVYGFIILILIMWDNEKVE